MRSRKTAAVAVLAGVLCQTGTASAQQDATDELPTVRLDLPAFERGVARRPSVRAVVEVRDCSARPTVTVTATWRRRAGRASMTVSGTHRILSFTPRRGARRTDRVTFRRVPLRRGTARATAAFSTNWLVAAEGGRRCEVRLPRLIGTGASAGAAAAGTLHLRTPLLLQTPVRPPPRRGTRTDHIWACRGGGSTFDCGLTVTLASSTEDLAGGDPGCPDESDCATKAANCPENDKQPACRTGDRTDPPDWAGVALLLLAGAAGLGGVGIAARQRPNEGGDVPDSWDDLARKEYAKPEQPISARASDLTKIGAPVAAFITAVLAAFGGWVADASDAPLGHTVIAVAIVVAVAVGGLFYVFAADFNSRAAVAVARFNNLCKHASAEEKADKAVLAQAEQATKAAEDAEKKADAAQKEAKTRTADAMDRIGKVTAEKAELEKELTAVREELKRCTERSAPAAERPGYLTLGNVEALAGGRKVRVHAIESADGRIVRYLVREPDGRLRWVSELDEEVETQ